jgi:hypothetical protein
MRPRKGVIDSQSPLLAIQYCRYEFASGSLHVNRPYKTKRPPRDPRQRELCACWTRLCA